MCPALLKFIVDTKRPFTVIVLAGFDLHQSFVHSRSKLQRLRLRDG